MILAKFQTTRALSRPETRAITACAVVPAAWNTGEIKDQIKTDQRSKITHDEVLLYVAQLGDMKGMNLKDQRSSKPRLRLLSLLRLC